LLEKGSQELTTIRGDRPPYRVSSSSRSLVAKLNEQLERVRKTDTEGTASLGSSWSSLQGADKYIGSLLFPSYF